KSFSLDAPIRARVKHDANEARIITCIINNIFVFNQIEYDRKVIDNIAKFTYYQNFLKRRSLRTKADVRITATLMSTHAENFELRFNVTGKNIFVPGSDPLPTAVEFEKKRFLAGDYSEASKNLSEFILALVIGNIILDD
ncbi:MAG TPA: hypothetical protein VGD40_04135, partial [Chryseosolibacter sp.]